MSKVLMKQCTLWGDLSSDRASEQYPEEPVCARCIELEQDRGEDSSIVSIGSVVTDPEAVCVLCGCGHDD